MNLKEEIKRLENIVEDLKINIIKKDDNIYLFHHLREINKLQIKIRKISSEDDVEKLIEEILNFQEKLYRNGIKIWGNLGERYIMAIVYLIISGVFFVGIFKLFMSDLSSKPILYLICLFFLGGLFSKWMALSLYQLKERENNMIIKNLVDFSANLFLGMIVIIFILILSKSVTLPEKSDKVLLISFTLGYAYELSVFIFDKIISKGKEVIEVLIKST